jgi:hypothetical protein
MKRHIEKFENPEESDIDESGENHLAHVAWNALVAVYMMDKQKCIDDRYKVEKQDVLTGKVYLDLEQGSEQTSGSGDSGPFVANPIPRI